MASNKLLQETLSRLPAAEVVDGADAGEDDRAQEDHVSDQRGDGEEVEPAARAGRVVLDLAELAVQRGGRDLGADRDRRRRRKQSDLPGLVRYAPPRAAGRAVRGRNAEADHELDGPRE